MTAVPTHRLIDTKVPRYTSYPTAPHFHDSVTSRTVAGWIGALAADEAISLYLHIPFCDRLCWFCACHTKQTLRYGPVSDYLATLHSEIILLGRHLSGRGIVRAIHLGGGSPTMIRPDDLQSLFEQLHANLTIAADASVSIEIDPNDMDEARLDALARVGTTRASLGIQDFDPRVQKAINREQGFEITRDIVDGLRARGVGSVNLDLLYGLPFQTVATLGKTIDLSLSLQPDRVAIFGYAHVPWFKKHQTIIDEAALPDPDSRLEQAQSAAALIRKAGYQPIGIDHFALPTDSLAMAAREGRLTRNFQGYTDDPCETLIGLGPSSISRFREGYAQNTPSTGEYSRLIEAGSLAIARGLSLSGDDRLRGWVIERLMCDFGFSSIALRNMFGENAEPILREAAMLAQVSPHFVANDGGFSIKRESRLFARSIAAHFDRYLNTEKARHSAAI
ncbi:oxygen-independent coproporphyrinogen III oxidase [Rhizobium miluonense]|uniref:Coproporphyrinogen-III oxidase n=1 Tax=Rhizobium miluonense TaxID=411945 RepID=A0A1C3WEU2_9HYPH|nr:oxygen-independent coproporphyrinogen III oxidase [Rhizobium miluonense]SCB38587.1 oxygen-independent coproporphyrinogen-3 oxidase [Rhizobium miluonense]